MSTEGMKNAGQTLKTERERLGLSLQDISTATKISLRVLRALESGDADSLPAKSFARGFLRSYAQYLKINPQPLLDAFDLEDAFIKNEGRVPTAPPENVPVTPKINSPAQPIVDSTVEKMQAKSAGPKAVYIIIVAILIVLIVGIKRVVDKYANERVVDPVTGVTDADTSAVTPTTTPSADSELKPTPTSPQEGKALPAVSSTPEPKATATPIPTATPKPTPTPEPKETDKPSADKPKDPVAKPVAKQEVIVEALDAVELEISIDGGPKTTLKLTPESIHTIKAKESIDLTISDGGLVNIIQNGKDRGNPGDLGKPIKIKYP